MLKVVFLCLLPGLLLTGCTQANFTVSSTPLQSLPVSQTVSPTTELEELETDQPMMSSPTPGAFDPARLGTVERDVTYCFTPDGEALKMDVYFPAQGQPPFPTVVYVHGGSWVAGDKSEGNYIPEKTNLVQGGNVFVSINYRLAPGYRFPAQIEDVKCAVRSLRANTDQWGIDPDRIAAMGSSAGGHLVALLGTADEQAGWDTRGGYTSQSSRVSGVVDLFGPAVVPEDGLAGQDMNLLWQVFGAKDLRDPALQKASPATYISPDDPPFLILHGTEDNTVPLAQSQRLTELLQAGGVEAHLIVVENAGHGMPSPTQIVRPSFEEIWQSVKDFMERTIGRRAA